MKVQATQNADNTWTCTGKYRGKEYSYSAKTMYDAKMGFPAYVSQITGAKTINVHFLPNIPFITT